MLKYVNVVLLVVEEEEQVAKVKGVAVFGKGAEECLALVAAVEDQVVRAH